MKKDRGGLGALGGAVVLSLLLVLVVVGASVIAPYAGRQDLSTGDYFVYSVSGTFDGSDVESRIALVVLKVDGEQVRFGRAVSGIGGGSHVDVVPHAHKGGMLSLDYEIFELGPFVLSAFVDLDDLSDFEDTSWLSLSSFTPILVQKHTVTVGDLTISILVKMGTSLVVAMEIVHGEDILRLQMEDSSILWVKVF